MIDFDNSDRIAKELSRQEIDSRSAGTGSFQQLFHFGYVITHSFLLGFLYNARNKIKCTSATSQLIESERSISFQ